MKPGKMSVKIMWPNADGITNNGVELQERVAEKSHTHYCNNGNILTRYNLPTRIWSSKDRLGDQGPGVAGDVALLLQPHCS